MKNKILGSILLVSVLLSAGCRKDLNRDYTGDFDLVPSNSAQLKVIYASAYPTNPSVQIKLDGKRVSGLITGRTPFPGGGFNTTGSNFPDYLLVNNGARQLSISIPKRNTETDSIVLFNTNFSVDAGKKYTLNVMDTGVNTKSLLVVDTMQNYSRAMVKYRFVNLMPNVPSVDLYYGTVLVAAGVAYNSPGVTISMPTPPTTLAWAIRETGSATNLATYSSGNTIVGSRVYTAFAMGYKGQSSTALRPYISFTINK
ncbi:MAG TPA: DUF4397 domain-containing protein [Ferruginibacter sp.]|nr:DUF4397 domain-containing protein [Ferruginibacter sp.]